MNFVTAAIAKSGETGLKVIHAFEKEAWLVYYKQAAGIPGVDYEVIRGGSIMFWLGG